MVDFSSNFSFSSHFLLVFLAYWFECLLLGILLGLSLFLAVGSIYQAVIQSLHFHSFILKIQKYTLCIMEFVVLVV
jgi:hypothetical protein